MLFILKYLLNIAILKSVQCIVNKGDSGVIRAFFGDCLGRLAGADFDESGVHVDQPGFKLGKAKALTTEARRRLGGTADFDETMIGIPGVLNWRLEVIQFP